METKSLPPIKVLFTDSFHLLKSVFAPLIVFNILTFIASVVLIIIPVVLFFVFILSFISSGITPENLASLIVPGIIVFIATLPSIIVSFISSIGSLIILYEGKSKISIWNVAKGSFKLIIPLILVGILMSLIIIGGFFLLIIPGIIFSVFFSFAYLVVITEKKGPVMSLKRSMNLVTSNFVEIFVRILILWGISLLVFILFSILDSMSDDTTAAGISLINIVVNLALNFFSISYVVTLFKQLQKVNPSGVSSLKVVTILSVIGWVIALLLGFVVASAIPTFIEEFNNNREEFESELTPEERKEFEKIMEQIESGEFNLEDIEREMDDTNDMPAIPSTGPEYSTPPAETI